jgi:hypothetical protein
MCEVYNELYGWTPNTYVYGVGKEPYQLAVLMLGMPADLPRHVPLDHSDGMKSVGKTNNFVEDLPYSTARWSRAGSVYRQS